jgi:hypothetical protein
MLVVGLAGYGELRSFGSAIATALIVLYVLVWVPGKQYYTGGLAPAVLAAGRP